VGKILVTAALPYANGRVHLGHLAGAYLPADIFVRWRRLKGDDAVFICGSDEHGVPITLSALKKKCSPQDIVDEFHALNGAAFAAAGVQFDIWGRTSSPEHHALSQEFFTKLLAKGYIDTREIEQYYSEQSKMFLPDRYVEGVCPHCGNAQARGDQCDACGGTYEVTELKEPRCALPGDTSKPVLKPTKHWFLRLDKFQQGLEAFVAQHKDGAQAWRANAQRGAEGWLKSGLRARCITRDTEWGVKIPLNEPGIEGKRLYVWFDAPIGYVTFTQQLFAQRGNADGWRDYWQNPECPIYNFIGKDNIPFHAITWPAMELGYNDAAGGGKPYQLATQVVANEFLNFGADKFSKSRGNLIELGWFVEKIGAEPLRYYLNSIAPEDNDSAFTWEDFLRKYNGELADVIGNFVHRSVTFTHKYFESVIPTGGADGENEAKFRAEIEAAQVDSAAALDGLHFKAAQARLIELGRAGNKYFDERAPWKQRKESIEACGTTLRVCAEAVATLGLALRPFLPVSSAKILALFGVSEADAVKPGSAGRKGRDLAAPGLKLGVPEVLYKKIEEKDLPTTE